MIIEIEYVELRSSLKSVGLSRQTKVIIQCDKQGVCVWEDRSKILRVAQKREQ